MKKLVFVLWIVSSPFVSIAQPTQRVADALQAIEDQGGLLVGTSYGWIASEDDEIESSVGTYGIHNEELYVNDILYTAGFEFLSVLHLLALTITG